MRRLLRDVAEGRKLGDTTTLADESVVDEIRDRRRGTSGGLTPDHDFMNSFRRHWQWRHKPRPQGDCVVVDIDGVLADAAHRQHYLDPLQRLGWLLC